MPKRRQLGRPPSTTTDERGRAVVAVTISAAVKMRASIFSLRHRVALGQMVEEGLKLFMAQWRERTREPVSEPAQLPLDEQHVEPEAHVTQKTGRAPIVRDQEV